VRPGVHHLDLLSFSGFGSFGLCISDLSDTEAVARFAVSFLE